MISIRRNTFETNSSSTHCLCFEKSVSIVPEDLEKLKEAYIIKPYTYEEVDDGMEITSIRDKLRYFYTLYIQADHVGKVFMTMLKQLVPNVIFSEEFSTNTYIFEDGEYFFSGCCYGDPAECDDLTENDLIKLLLYGTIHFGDRDRESYYDKISDIVHDKNYFSVEWSG